MTTRMTASRTRWTNNKKKKEQDLERPLDRNEENDKTDLDLLEELTPSTCLSRAFRLEAMTQILLQHDVQLQHQQTTITTPSANIHGPPQQQVQILASTIHNNDNSDTNSSNNNNDVIKQRPRQNWNNEKSRTTGSTTEYTAWQWLLDMDSVMTMNEQCTNPVRVLQRYALASVYLETHGHTWNVQGKWLQSEYHECEWYRIQCGNKTSTNNNDDSNNHDNEEQLVVTELDLSRNRLFGTIPTVIGLLTNLQVLSLWRNALSGTIPWTSVVSRLTQLKTLDVEENRLTGPIVVSTVPASLEEFRVGFNLLTGQLVDIMSTVGQEVANSNSHGNHLRQLWMEENLLTGPLPQELSLPVLEELALEGNYLEGPLPLTLFSSSSFSALHTVRISDNQLSGRLPLWGGNNSDSLRVLRLAGNRFTGTIPSIGPGQWPQLTELRLERNLLSGSMPASLCGLVPSPDIHTATTSSTSSSLLVLLTADCDGENGDQDEPLVFCECCTTCF
mmetsp:Transcript_10079/g.18381  ORF Transcript_10079/g.18381 Transcript_10079/m.18381 type:complete len:503 (+) Transcript_10079:219-1727(+)